eukprot:CAMPEP_0170154576 /NCGR_PEP_ID=MMETSP0033_2-20121228/58315_1 /TAXON_ID=195969 /ORGANISM="Dolichomastix tenuilepis, Strain CCMP3274" /LENGTH=133 /DNA_ID=CAMNT_0010391835 /DNA_START=106 /DNA_END=503 /DNA_ORIENTATION=+
MGMDASPRLSSLPLPPGVVAHTVGSSALVHFLEDVSPAGPGKAELVARVLEVVGVDGAGSSASKDGGQAEGGAVSALGAKAPAEEAAVSARSLAQFLGELGAEEEATAPIRFDLEVLRQTQPRALDSALKDAA